jgi:hypothetical protein
MRKIPYTAYLSPKQKLVLGKLSTATRVPIACYIREGIDLLLAKYDTEIRKEALRTKIKAKIRGKK